MVERNYEIFNFCALDISCYSSGDRDRKSFGLWHLYVTSRSIGASGSPSEIFRLGLLWLCRRQYAVRRLGGLCRVVVAEQTEGVLGLRGGLRGKSGERIDGHDLWYSVRRLFIYLPARH